MLSSHVQTFQTNLGHKDADKNMILEWKVSSLKALVLSGGSGSRLRPLTHTRSKHLLPLANRPILHHVLDNIAQSGLKEVVVLHGANGQEIRDSVGDGSRWSLSVTYVQQDQPLGLAHAVQTAQHTLGNEAFLMYLGDNILSGGIGTYLQDFYRHKPDAMILLHHVNNPSSYGIAELKGERVLRLMEKPADPPSTLAVLGVYFFSPEIHHSIGRIKPSDRGELEITDAIQDLINHGHRVEARILKERWYDTGTPDNLLQANQDLLNHLVPMNRGQVDGDSQISGPVVIGAHTVVEHTHIMGPAIIGDHVHLAHAMIGPYTSIADDVSIIHSRISHSIVMEGCRLQEAGSWSHCILGEETVIARELRTHTNRQLLSGDHTRFILPKQL